jgi:hypothetical protein
MRLKEAFCQLKFAKNSFLTLFLDIIWSYGQKAVLLHRVFHGIRFKVK